MKKRRDFCMVLRDTLKGKSTMTIVLKEVEEGSLKFLVDVWVVNINPLAKVMAENHVFEAAS